MSQVLKHSYPWYAADWKKSETRIELDELERGLYRELLDHCWEEGSLPNNDRAIQSIASFRDKPFKQAWPAVREKFFLGEDGRLHNPGVDSRRDKIIGLKEKRKQIGSNGGNQKQANRVANDLANDASEELANDVAKQLPKTYPSSSRPVPSRPRLAAAATPEPPPAARSIEISLWSLTAEAIRRGRASSEQPPQWPTVDDEFVIEVIRDSLDAVPPDKDLTDEVLAAAVLEAAVSKPNQNRQGLFLKTVPEVIRTWSTRKNQ